MQCSTYFRNTYSTYYLLTTNLEIPVDFSKTYVLNPRLFFWNSPIYRQQTNFWWNFWRAGSLFFTSALCNELFIQTFSQFPYQKVMVLWAIYTPCLGSYSCHDSKCQMYSHLALCRYLSNVVNANGNIFLIDNILEFIFFFSIY